METANYIKRTEFIEAQNNIGWGASLASLGAMPCSRCDQVRSGWSRVKVWISQSTTCFNAWLQYCDLVFWLCFFPPNIKWDFHCNFCPFPLLSLSPHKKHRAEGFLIFPLDSWRGHLDPEDNIYVFLQNSFPQKSFVAKLLQRCAVQRT